MRVVFKTQNQTLTAELNESQTAKEITQRLPLSSTVSKWGNEVYFDLGFKVSAEGATMDVAVGDIAYWPQGKCLCIFFGPTPQSTDPKPVPASPVVIVGKVLNAPQMLREVELGEKITVSVAPRQEKADFKA